MKQMKKKKNKRVLVRLHVQQSTLIGVIQHLPSIWKTNHIQSNYQVTTRKDISQLERRQYQEFKG